METTQIQRYININEVLVDGEYLNESIKCTLCMNVLIDPSQCSKCQRCVCKRCLDNLFVKRCPGCSTTTFAKCSRGLLNDLDKLKLKCPLRCTKIILYKDYFKHFDVCENTVSKCKNKNCNFESKRKELLVHYKDCQWRIRTCSYCDAQIRQCDKNAHEAKCEMKKNVMKLQHNSHYNKMEKSRCLCKDNCSNLLNQTNTDRPSESCYQCKPDLTPEFKDIVCEEEMSIRVKCGRCEVYKNKKDGRCARCLKLLCDKCNPDTYESLDFYKKIKKYFNKIFKIPEDFCKRPSFFCHLYQLCDLDKKSENRYLRILIIYCLLGWLEMMLIMTDIIILFVLVLGCGFSMILVFNIFSIYNTYLYLFRRRKICRENCDEFSYKELLKTYILKVCQHGEILGSIEGESWASSKKFRLNRTYEAEGKSMNDFLTIKNIFYKNLFIKNSIVNINSHPHTLVNYDEEDILYLERQDGGTLISQSKTKFIVGSFNSNSFITNTQNKQNFYDTKNKIMQLTNLLKKKKL